ncbi:M23 family metallopeptidase, partial [Klebsiella pneumoniae]|nr:M23 family metallopeptidase [Klebsiella pneumoniae]
PLAAFSGNELVYSATLGDWRTHNGADYAAPAGESVTAAKAGKVVSVSEDALWGGVVEVEDANGVTWRYCGVAAPAVKAGDSVTAAAALGTAG